MRKTAPLFVRAFVAVAAFAVLTAPSAGARAAGAQPAGAQPAGEDPHGVSDPPPDRLPGTTGPLPVPALAGADPEEPALFPTSDRCVACHNGMTTRAGADLSIGHDWRGSMMANAARDPYWQAAVTREVEDHPGAREAIEAECSRCHMPMANVHARAFGEAPRLFAHLPIGEGDTREDVLAADGVSCGVCHQIRADNLGTEESFVGNFVIDTERPWGEREVYGPFEVIAGLGALMRSAARFDPKKAEHIRTSELCATCHTLYTHTYRDGEAIGRLPEQVPYLEWRHSAYPGRQTCQDCHMPIVEGPAPIASVLGPEQEGARRHVFRGGNFVVPRMLNRHRGELGVTATPGELEATATRTAAHLQARSARLHVTAGLDAAAPTLVAEVRVENLAGHKLPTAYPSRRAWIHLVVRDAEDAVVFESGALRESGYIEGNDNDADPRAFEPHYQIIDAPDQVQIYESILATPEGLPTTGLLTAIRYVKDNRVLPDGFDKATAHEDFAVQGGARDDADFTGGVDRVRYRVDLADAPGPYRVEASLWYQPISFRWAHNLEPYGAERVQRFVRYYEEASAASALELVRASTKVGPAAAEAGPAAVDLEPAAVDVEPAAVDVEPATTPVPQG